MRTHVRLEVLAYELMRRRLVVRSIVSLVTAALFAAACGSNGSVAVVSEATTTVANTNVSIPAETTDVPATDPPETTSTTTSSVPQPPVDPLTWKACPGSKKLKCAELVVPYDYENPSVGSFTIPVRMRPADTTPSVGPLFVNRGGPAAGASRARATGHSCNRRRRTDRGGEQHLRTSGCSFRRRRPFRLRCRRGN